MGLVLLVVRKAIAAVPTWDGDRGLRLRTAC